MFKKGNNIFSLLIIILSVFMTSSSNIINAADSPTPETPAVTKQTDSDLNTNATPKTSKDWGSQLITKVQLQDNQGNPKNSFTTYEPITVYWEFSTPKGGVNAGDTMTVTVPEQLTITTDITQPITETPGGQPIAEATLSKADHTITVTFTDYGANKSKNDPVTGSFYVKTNWNLNLVQEHQNVPIDWNVTGTATNNPGSTGSASVEPSSVTDPNEILYKYGSYIENGDIIQWTVRVNYKGEKIPNAVYRDTLGQNQTLLKDADHPITVNSATADHATGNITNDTNNKFANATVTVTTAEDGFDVNFGDEIDQTAIITYYTKITDLANKLASYSNTGDLLSNNDELQNITINQPNTSMGGDAQGSEQVTSIMGHKIWNVPDGTTLPTSVTINLLQNGNSYKSQKVIPETNWSYVFNNLPKYDRDGNAYNYTVQETPVTGFTSIPDPTNYNITNVLSKLTVTKDWNDNNNANGLRPTSVIVGVYGTDLPEPNYFTLDGDNNWTHTLEDIPPNADWTVSEIGYNGDFWKSPKGYIATPTQTTNNGNKYDITITNTLATTFKVTKNWDDGNDFSGRPTEIKVELYAQTAGSDKLVDTNKSATLNADDDWSYTFGSDNDLPKFDTNKKEITYSAGEIKVPGYTTSYKTNDADTEEIITNTKVAPTTHLTVNKIWKDDKTSHDPVDVELLADNVDTGKKITLSDRNKWSDTFADLATQKDGKDINYTVSEVNPGDYTPVIEQDNDTNTATIINTPKVTTPTTRSFKVIKKWRGDTETDRPKSINVYLTVNGTKQAKPVTISPDASGNWSYTWNDLAINDKDGNPIDYSVSEDTTSDPKLDNYVSNVDTTNDGTADAIINNTLKPTTPDTAKTSMTVKKQWNDDNDKDKLRTKSVEVQLTANGNVVPGKTVTLNDANNWTYTWENLDKQSNNQDITYSVSEKEIPDYTSEKVSNGPTYITLINNHTPKTTTPTDNTGSFQVKKYWNDDNNKDGLRPTEIKVQLTANGQNSGNPITLNAKNDWAYTWKDLAKQSNGSNIIYKIKEFTVPGYTTKIDPVDGGANITNIHVPKTAVPTTDKTYLTVTKVWNDENNRDEIRPNQVLVHLLTNGKTASDAIILNKDNNWSHTWKGLDKSNSYSVYETPVDGYSKSIKVIDDNNIVLTNTLQPKKPSIPSKPDTPKNPDIPVIPGSPDNPGNPFTPDNPGGNNGNNGGNGGTGDQVNTGNGGGGSNATTDFTPGNPMVPSVPYQKTNTSNGLLPQTGSKDANILYSILGVLILGFISIFELKRKRA